MKQTDREVIRELMIALDVLRHACEHAEGRRKIDNEMLTTGMSTGLQVLHRHRWRIKDYQQDSYWLDARLLVAKTTNHQLRDESEVLNAT